jgi:hypothetical protein
MKKIDKNISSLPENIINVDFKSIYNEDFQDTFSSEGEDLEVIKKVVRRHNTVLKMLYSLIEDIVKDFESRVSSLENKINLTEDCAGGCS